MFLEEIVVLLLFVFPHVLAASCMPKCGIPSEWLPTARNICYGTKNEAYAKFMIKRDCDLYAIRLSHVSGFQAWDKGGETRWGYREGEPTRICTLLLRDKKRWFPEKVEHQGAGYYYLNGFLVDDDVLILKKNATFVAGTELEIAFGADFASNRGDSGHVGTHCVDVDVSCFV